MRTPRLVFSTLLLTLLYAPSALAAWTFVTPQKQNLRYVATVHSGSDAKDRMICLRLFDSDEGSCRPGATNLTRRDGTTLFTEDDSPIATFWAISEPENGFRGKTTHHRRASELFCQRTARRYPKPGAYCR